MSCLFCRIASGEIPASKVYEDTDVLAFNDINPQAPLHVLVIPKQHIATTNDLTEADEALVGKLVRTAAALAAQKGYADRGYRVVFNCNAEAGQTVFHIHLHLLAGRSLGWPPG
jgi:histidine triad (HIT) family protein